MRICGPRTSSIFIRTYGIHTNPCEFFTIFEGTRQWFCPVRLSSEAYTFIPGSNTTRSGTEYFEACLSAMDQYEKLGNPDRIVANSKFAASYLEEVYGRKVTDIVYPGVNRIDLPTDPPPPVERISPHAGTEYWLSRVASAEYVIVTIGQLWPHKRIDLVIQACSLVEGVHLCVIGQGPERRYASSPCRGSWCGAPGFFSRRLVKPPAAKRNR